MRGAPSRATVGPMASRTYGPMAVVLACALGACGTSPPATDAGAPPADAATYTCDRTMRVDGVMDAPVTVMLDTSTTPELPRDLGLACGNPEAELRWARQEAIEFHVPGSGPVAVRFDTTLGITAPELNTVVQVRNDCRRIPVDRFPATCFDDANEIEWRSAGGVLANGGDVLYFIVTGYSDPPAEWMTITEGPIQIDFVVTASAPPTLSAGTIRLVGDDVQIAISGSDADADVQGVALNFYDGSGLLDIWGDGEARENDDVFVVRIAPPPADTIFDETLVVRGTMVNLAGYIRAVGATRAQIRVFDATQATSEPLDASIL